MSPRTGRPVKGDSKRDNKLTIVLTDGEKELLNECAERKNMPRTDVIVEGIKLVKRELDAKKEQNA